MTLSLRAAVATDLGLVRDNNEDAAFAGRCLVAVADGIGGAPGGELASEAGLCGLGRLVGGRGERRPPARPCPARGGAHMQKDNGLPGEASRAPADIRAVDRVIDRDVAHPAVRDVVDSQAGVMRLADHHRLRRRADR